MLGALAPQADAAAPRHPVKPPPGAAAGAGFSFEDWTINTDTLDANWTSGSFNSPGHITLTRPGNSIDADRATGNMKLHQAVLVGHVILHDSNGALTGFAGTASRSNVPATLTCDNLNIDGVSKTYTATGNVFFIQGGRSVRADRAIMNGATHDIHLFGHVQLKQ